MSTKQTETERHEEWLSVRAACALVGVSPATLRRWSNAGAITTFTTPGGHRRFARSAVLELLPTSAAAIGHGDEDGGNRAGNGGQPACIGLLARRIGDSLAEGAGAPPAERAAALRGACSEAVELGRAAARQGLWMRAAVEALLDAAPPPGETAYGPGTTDLLIRAVMQGYDRSTARVPAGERPEDAAEPEQRAPLTASVVAFVAHALDVRSAEREAFADRIAAMEVHEGMILVRTCHRTELYATPAALAARPLPDPPPGTRRLVDVDAVRHLISVACGLESAILGEDQILGQLRDAFAARRSAGALDPVLGRLFQVALHAGRRAHAWLGGAHRSLGDVAVERALGTAECGADRPLLIVGAGSMGRLTALAAGRRGLPVVIANRTRERADALAREVGGSAAPFGVDATLPAVAGVVVALGGPWAIGPDAAARLAAGGVRVVDLSSPPAVPPDLIAALGDRYTSIDDLAWGPGSELAPSLAGRLDRLVSESGGEFCAWLRTREAVPAIHAMTRAAEERRGEELEWLRKRLPGLGEEERAVIAQMTNRLVAGLLHGPRSALASDTSGALGRAALELFGQ